MKYISREQLQDRLAGADRPTLVEVLSPETFDAFHLPGAINVPLEKEFSAHVQRAIPDKNAPVVVYGWDDDGLSSIRAAMTMENLGYEDVTEYAGGKTDWVDAGLPVE